MTYRFVNNELKIITSPKAAQSYLSHVMKKCEPTALSDNDSHVFTIFVIRHPMDRLVSTWTFFSGHKEFGHRQFPAYYHPDNTPLTFEEFCRMRIDEGVVEGHLRYQYEALEAARHVDYFCTLEDFDDVLIILAKEFPHLSIDDNAGRHNQSERDPDWRSYLEGQDLIDLQRIHAIDTVLYNLAKKFPLTLEEALAEWRK